MKKFLRDFDGRWLMQTQRWPRGAVHVPRIQAHRGFWLSGQQENTLAAFREAKKQGALMVETDVMLSRDQVPILFHDKNLQRLAGSPNLVRDLSLVELQQKVKLTTLQELLMDKDSPSLVNIELKSTAIVEDALERKVAEVVKKTKAQTRVLFSSFNPFSLYRISLHLPDVPRALLVSPEKDPDNSLLLRKMWLAPFFSFHILHLDQRIVTPNNMEFWRKRKIPVSVWTVNGKENVSHFLQMGCLSVISDDWNSVSESLL